MPRQATKSDILFLPIMYTIIQLWTAIMAGERNV